MACLWWQRAASRVKRRMIWARSRCRWVFVLIFWLGQSAQAADFAPNVLFSAFRSVVRIEATRPAHGVQVGTGVVLAQRKVATACHVVRDATKVSVIHGGRRFFVSGLQAMPKRDVCVFTVKGLNAQPAQSRAATQLQVGEQDVALGFSGGGPIRWGIGEVARIHYFEGGQVLQTSASFTSGASGGPLLDAEGKVVGLLTFRMRGLGPQFYSVPIEWAVDIVEKMDHDKAVDTGFDHLSFWERNADELPFFMRASSLETEQRWPELRALCEAWQRADPQSGEPAFIESRLDERSGRFEAARAKLEQAVFRDPHHALAWSALARARLRIEDVSGARKAYSRLILLSDVLADRLLAEQSDIQF